MTVDAIVIGSGPNGLAAAVELARAGHNVTVYEAADSIGGGMRSYEQDGVVHDVCSAIHPLLLASPFFRDIGLQRLGIEAVHPGLPLAHPLPGGRAAVLDRSVSTTADGLGVDSRAYKDLVGPLVEQAELFLPAVLGPSLRIPGHPLALARFLMHAVRGAEQLARRTFTTPEARGLFAGLAAHSMLPLSSPPSAGVGLLLALLAHHVGWPLVRGGSQRIADGMAALLRELGGEIVTGTRVSDLDELPKARAYICDISPRDLHRIARNRLPRRYLRALQRYRFGPGVFKIDWTVSEPVPWLASECRRAGTVHVGWSLEDVATSERDANAGRLSQRPFILISQQSLFDPTRASNGRHNLWAYCHVPSGSDVDLTEMLEARVEEFAPGFRDTIVSRSTRTARAYEAYNPNFVGGDINTGVQDVFQHIARPALRFSPYSTPARDVYICSSATPPGGGVHGMCGRHAARAALKRAF